MVRQIKDIAILLLTLLSSTPIYAHNYRNAESTQPTHHLVCTYAELFSVDVWKLEAAYHWFPIKYQCCPKRFIDTMNMRLLWTTTPSKLFWAPFIPLQLALAEV